MLTGSIADDQGDEGAAWPDASSAQRAVDDLRRTAVPEEPAIRFRPWSADVDVDQ